MITKLYSSDNQEELSEVLASYNCMTMKAIISAT